MAFKLSIIYEIIDCNPNIDSMLHKIRDTALVYVANSANEITVICSNEDKLNSRLFDKFSKLNNKLYSL